MDEKTSLCVKTPAGPACLYINDRDQLIYR